VIRVGRVGGVSVAIAVALVQMTDGLVAAAAHFWCVSMTW
jgi:hypothetical protein